MSECCWDCFKKQEAPYSKITRKDVLLTKDSEYCDFCGRLKPVVICYSRVYRFCEFWRDRRDAFRLLRSLHKK